MTIITSQPVLRVTGDPSPIEIEDLALVTSQSDAGWSADVALTRPADYARLPDGAAVELDYFGTIYRLVVNGRRRRRRGAGLEQPLTLVSSVLRARPRLTRTWSDPCDAQALVEAVLGRPVLWQMVPWTVPAGAVAVTDALPLEVAQQVVTAGGGVIQSAPDDTLICRPKYPLWPGAWNGTAPDYVLSDHDVVEADEDPEPTEFANCLTVDDGAAAAGLELSTEEIGPGEVLVRAAVTGDPAPTATLVHAGDQRTAVVELGVVGRGVPDEAIVITGGRGQAACPVWEVTATEWCRLSLGRVRPLTPGGREVVAEIDGISLVKLSYTTKAWSWRVTSPDDEVLVSVADELGGVATERLTMPKAETSAAAASSANSVLSIELADSLNGGRSSWAPGDTAWLHIWGNVPLKALQLSAGDLIHSGSGAQTTRVDEVTFGGTAEASLPVPVDAVDDVEWLGTNLGKLELDQADRQTVRAAWAGAAVARITSRATPVRTIAVRAPTALNGSVDFPIVVAAIGAD